MLTDSQAIPDLLILTGISLLVILLPGLAWLANLPGREGNPLDDLIRTAAAGIAITGLLWLSTAYFHFSFPALTWPIFYGICLVAAITGWLRHGLAPRNILAGAGLALLLAGLIAFRFYQVRGLVYPAWVDSVQHAVITQWLVTAGRLASPADYLPFSYYFGFHALAANSALLSGRMLNSVLLVLGQVISALIPLAVAALARRIFHKNSIAWTAGILTAVISQMPAYYSSWGRYTMLTASFLVLAGMGCLEAMLGDRNARRSQAALLALVVGGIWISHYLLGILFSAYVFIRLVVSWKDGLFRRGRPAMLAMTIGMLVVTPWLIHAWGFAREQADIAFVDPLGSSAQSIRDYSLYLLSISGPICNYVFLALGLAGLIWVAIRREAISLATWCGLVILLSLPVGIRLAPFRPDHFVILLWLPFSLLAANLLVTCVEAAAKLLHDPRANMVLLAVLLLPMLLWGAWDSRSIINLKTILADRWDLDATQWIRANLNSASILINVVPWQSGIYRGADGGYWLGVLTDARIHPDMNIYTWLKPEASGRVRAEAVMVSGMTQCDPAFLRYLEDQEIDAIYVHLGAGAIQPAMLKDCAGVTRAYGNEQVILYRVQR